MEDSWINSSFCEIAILPHFSCSSQQWTKIVSEIIQILLPSVGLQRCTFPLLCTGLALASGFN